ncbi:MAG: hypothetical protein JOZ72_01740 [Alphaproteobacteria bacterium]|nr:hypothetical protein [Alphaproteobacteria bacterium]
MTTFRGTNHDDTFNEASDTASDIFVLYKGGNDTVVAGSGDDVFKLGGAMNAGDRLDGGAGRDVVFLSGDYSAGLTLDDLTLQNIEVLRLRNGFDYKLAMADGNVAAGTFMSVDGRALGATHGLIFDGSAETDGHYLVYGGKGDDTLTGGALADKFHLEQGGNDTAHGGGGDDVFAIGRAFTAADVIDGGAGTDTLDFDGGYTGANALILGAQSGVAGIEKLSFASGHSYAVTVVNNITDGAGATLTVDASALTASDTFSLDLTGATSAGYTVAGGAGNDSIKGSNTGSTYHLEAGGNDSLTAGSGDDTIYMGASLTASDTINGGGGRGDTLILDGDYSAGLVLNATTVTKVAKFEFAAGHDYKITLDAATVASTDSFAADGSKLGATDSLAFDASAMPVIAFLTITGGAGDDVLTTGSHTVNTFDITRGGDDTINCAGARNTVNAGAAFDTGDTITASGRVTLNLDGDYSAGMTLNNVSGSIVVFNMAVGNDYNFTLGAGLAAVSVSGGDSTHSLFLDASPIGGNLSVLDYFGSSTITGGSRDDSIVIMTPAAGANILHGGGGNDTFQLNGIIGADDLVDGGAGSDTLTIAFNSTITDSNITHIDTLDLAHDLTILGDITGGEGTLTIDFLSFDGTVDLTGATTTSFVLEGKGSIDTFKFAANFTAADSISGFEGDDILELNGDYTDGLTLSGSVINALRNVHLDAGHSYDLAVSGDIVTNTYGEVFVLKVNAAALGAGDTMTLDLTAATVKGGYAVTGGAGDDTVTFGGNLAASYTFDGGAGNDTLELNGDYSAGLAFGASTLTSVETLKLDDGHSYELTTNDGNVAGGATMTIDASALTGTHTLTFDGSGETNGAFIFAFAGGFTASDSITGGAGGDTLSLNGDYSLGVTFGASTLAGVENIIVADGHTYSLATNDANVAAGATMTIDASALTGSNQLFFDGTAETDGHFAFISGVADDVINGGKLSDSFDMSRSNGAFVNGFDGNDSFTFTAAANLLADSVNGGTGTDTLVLNGDFSTQTALTAGNLASIEALQLLGGAHSYNLTFADAVTTALSVDASAAASLTFSGAGDTTTTFTITGSTGADHITGGNKGDHFTGGGGADVFAYTAAAQSTGTTYDTVTDFAAGTDTFDFTTTVTQVYSASGSLDSGSSFDNELFGLNIMHANGATELTVTGGTLAGHVFLVVDGDGNATYNAGSDYVIDITGHTGTITTGDFI